MLDQIKKIILEIKPELTPLPNDDLNLTEVLDSMDIIFLVAAIERDCGIIIDGIDIVPENFSSLQMIVKFINRKLP